jgi:hypothetical protein
LGGDPIWLCNMFWQHERFNCTGKSTGTWHYNWLQWGCFDGPCFGQCARAILDLLKCIYEIKKFLATAHVKLLIFPKTCENCRVCIILIWILTLLFLLVQTFPDLHRTSVKSGKCPEEFCANLRNVSTYSTGNRNFTSSFRKAFEKVLKLLVLSGYSITSYFNLILKWQCKNNE